MIDIRMRIEYLVVVDGAQHNIWVAAARLHRESGENPELPRNGNRERMMRARGSIRTDVRCSPSEIPRTRESGYLPRPSLRKKRCTG